MLLLCRVSIGSNVGNFTVIWLLTNACVARRFMSIGYLPIVSVLYNLFIRKNMS